ncbi:MAG: helicase-exonuclease AddAB subunit AddA [Phycisphaerae bacterium]
MSEIHWTEQQRRAIRTTGRSILVSAAAGSGKTAVLAERCAHLAADIRACDIDQLLVVTFTEAAAAEMRERIGRALHERLEHSPRDTRLRYQIVLLDTAQVSTIHGFCLRVLRREFSHADLDPAARLLDGAEASLLRQEVAARVFDAFAQRADARGECFLDLLAAYGGASERPLRKLVLGIDAFLESLPDRSRWLDETLARFEGASPRALPAFWLDQLRDTLGAELKRQIEIVQRRMQVLASDLDAPGPFVDCLAEYHAALESWSARLDRERGAAALDDLCGDVLRAYEFPGIPAKRGKAFTSLDDEAKQRFEAAQGHLQEIRNTLFKRGLQKAFGGFTAACWAEGVARIAPHVRTLITLLQAVRKEYQLAKADLGVLDFADLERKMLDLLRNEDNGVAARLRDAFEFVLVDEFQDVNPLQAEIIRRVSREDDPDRADNLFVVGDVKQSIYRFRLAEPRLFLKRLDEFKRDGGAGSRETTGLTIDLLQNFRSRERVIDAVNALFERLMAPDLGRIAYDEHARLKPGRADAAGGSGPAVELHVLDVLKPDNHSQDDSDNEPAAFDWERIEREAYVIARRIEKLRDDGFSYADIVILMRSVQQHAGLLVRSLLRQGIPVFADLAGGLFDALEVRDILSLLALLDNAQQDIPLAAVLRSPLLGEPLTDTQLAEIRTHARQRGGGLPFHAAVGAYIKDGPDDVLRQRLTDIHDLLHRWRERMRRRPVADVLWEVFEESGYLAYVGGLREGRQRRANLLQLHEHARRFGTFERQGLGRFLRFLDDLRDAGASVEAGTVAPPAGDVVRVMTIHRSKGLEFPVVIVAELGKRFNLSDARGSILFDRRLGLGLKAVDVQRRIIYPTLPHRLVSEAAKTESLAEELRVLYVAFTRARERLVLIGTGKPPTPDQETPGPLPLLERRGANCPLDWVSRALAVQKPEHVSGPEDGPAPAEALFAVWSYTADEMARWSIESEPNPDTTARLERLARMEPVEPNQPAAPDADTIERVTRRLTTTYPARALTRVPAVAAASVLKRRWNDLEDETEPIDAMPGVSGVVTARPGAETRADSPRSTRRFKSPAFLDATARPEPTALGTWTHTLLQYIDLSRPCDPADLKGQLADLVTRGILTRREADGIDLAGVAWFFSTPLGGRLGANGTRVRREWPFVLGVDPTRYDPAAVARGPDDVLLVRGIIDVLFDDGSGWEILDYKTDQVDGAALQERAKDYEGQLQIYAAAVEAVWKHRPRRKWLVFLSAREIVQL